MGSSYIATCSLCTRELTPQQLDNIDKVERQVYQRNFGGNTGDLKTAADITTDQCNHMLLEWELVYCIHQSLCTHHQPLLEKEVRKPLLWWKMLQTQHEDLARWSRLRRRRHSESAVEIGPVRLHPTRARDFHAQVEPLPIVPKPLVAPCFHTACRKPTEGEDCPICLGTLLEGKLVWCKASCGRNFHAACWDRHKASFRRTSRNGGADVSDEILCILCFKSWRNWKACRCDEGASWRAGSLASLWQQIHDSFHRCFGLRLLLDLDELQNPLEQDEFLPAEFWVLAAAFFMSSAILGSEKTMNWFSSVVCLSSSFFQHFGLLLGDR